MSSVGHAGEVRCDEETDVFARFIACRWTSRRGADRRGARGARTGRPERVPAGRL